MSHQVGGIIHTIHGNTEGLKNKHTKALLALYDRSITQINLFQQGSHENYL